MHHNPLRVVLDTNVLISAVLKQPPSIPDAIFQALKNHDFTLLTSPSILQEVEHVISRESIVKRTRMSGAQRKRFIGTLSELSVIVPEHGNIEAVKDDPDDDKFIACAIEGQGDFIVSGDKHLLSLNTFQGILIVSPKAFLDILVKDAHQPGVK